MEFFSQYSYIKQLTAPENTIIYHNALCLSPQILHKHCFHFLLGPSTGLGTFGKSYIKEYPLIEISAGKCSAHVNCKFTNFQTKMADLDHWIDIAKQCKYLPENDLKVTHADLSTFSFPVAFYELHSSHSLGHYWQKLCDYVCELLLEESNVQPVSTPVTVCGDIHGQVLGF